MKGCSPPITEADRIRYLAFQDIGCICCIFQGFNQVPPEAHHITQDDNQNTLPLCAWHHRGVPPADLSAAQATGFYGPSLAVSRRDFHEHFGLEEQLLESVNHRIKALLVAQRLG
jgi:hypothetical protein